MISPKAWLCAQSLFTQSLSSKGCSHGATKQVIQVKEVFFCYRHVNTSGKYILRLNYLDYFSSFSHFPLHTESQLNISFLAPISPIGSLVHCLIRF